MFSCEFCNLTYLSLVLLVENVEKCAVSRNIGFVPPENGGIVSTSPNFESKQTNCIDLSEELNVWVFLKD
jgi:hypothetical protein